LIGLAAFSSAMSELESTPEFDCGDVEIDRVMVGNGRPDCQRQFPVIANSCVPTFVAQNVSHADEFRWSGNVPAGQFN
jgi:hypothetical protein